MGNAQDTPPKNYNTNEVHEADYLQTYKGGGTGDKVDLGKGLPQLTMGAKIIESVSAAKDDKGVMQPAGEYYVMSKGKRLYLSKNKQFTDQAKNILTWADNYKQGPTVLVSGKVGSVKYTVFGGTSTAESNEYQPLEIHNKDDLRKALWVGHPNQQRGKYATQYGDLAVNPFEKRPRNFFSDLADVGRGIEKVADVVLVPIVELGLDELTDGLASTLMMLTGAEDALQGELDSLTESQGLDYNSTSNTTEDSMSSVIGDPRLDDYYNQIMKVSRDKAQKYHNQYTGELSKISNSRHGTAAAKMMVVHKLQDLNLRFDSTQQIDLVKKTAALFKKMVPNPPDFDWQTIENGLGAAQTPQQQINVSKFLTNQMLKKVMPFAKKRDTSVPDQKQSEPKASKKDPKAASAGQKQPQSATINGEKLDHQHKSEIQPFTQRA